MPDVQTGARIGFGTGSLLRIGSARERLQVLAAAFANGITHFDTAPIYGFGESERTLGRFLRGRRERVTLTTKFGLRPSALAARLAPLQRAARTAIKHFPALRRAAVRNTGALYSAPTFAVEAVRRSLDASLRSLRTDHVDFFLAHQACLEALPSQEVIGALEDLRRAGKIRAFGVATEFDWLMPVLQARPELAGVVQFDSEVARGNVATLGVKPGQMLITYCFINRTVAHLRERLRTGAGEPGAALCNSDDDTLGALILRAAAVANPGGIVLMQSRSVARIERNARAAYDNSDDGRVGELISFLRLPA